MSDQQNVDRVVQTAEWLAELATRARAQGDLARADCLLIFAWQAYDGQSVSLDGLGDGCSDQAKNDAGSITAGV